MATQFSEDLYQQIDIVFSKRNVFSSPFAIEVIFAIIYMCSEGDTAREIRETIGLPENKEEVAAKYKALLSNLLDKEKLVKIKMLNRLYLSKKYTLPPSGFLSSQENLDSFRMVAEAIDMTIPRKAAAEINKKYGVIKAPSPPDTDATWIQELPEEDHIYGIPPRRIPKNPKAILLSGLYVKGQWLQKFESIKKLGTFRLGNGQKTPVKMMSRKGKFLIGDFPELGAKVLELPFLQSELFMNIFVPYKLKALPALEEAIVGFNQTLDSVEAMVKMPQFKISFTYDVSKILAKVSACRML